MPDLDNPRQNHLLNALLNAEFESIFPELELVHMPLGKLVYKSGERLDYVYFPTSCIISLLYVTENGSSAEIAMVGYEGILGVSIFMGSDTTPSPAVVQSEGFGYRMKAHLLKNEFNRTGPVLSLLLRYTQALITQMSQTAVCNRHHCVEQQLCRWLLLNLDRLAGNELVTTQELIANMLGGRREDVTEAIEKLKREGLIEYSRRHIKVLNRPRIEKKVCECYQVVKLEYDRLLPSRMV